MAAEAKQKFKEQVKLLCETYRLKEDIDENTGELKGVILEGVAITFDKPTRNGVSYTYKSGLETHKGLVGKPFLDSHHDDSIRDYPPFGHVIETWIQQNKETGFYQLMYKVDIDPKEEQFIRKARRHDIPGVSIQVLVDEADEATGDNGEVYVVANITEFLELSSVLIPGDGDTTMRFLEKLKNRHKNTLSMRGEIEDDDGKIRPFSMQIGEEDVTTLGGHQINEPKDKDDKEELNTDNGGALIGEGEPKKVKPAEENIKFTKITKQKCIKCKKLPLLEGKAQDGSIALKCHKCKKVYRPNEALLKKTRAENYKQKILQQMRR